MTDTAAIKAHLEGASTKVLLLNDIHLRDRPPRNCTDAYLEDIFAILEFTTKLEQALDLDAVIWAGDIFDHKQPAKTSHRLVLRAIDIVKKHRRLLILTGNHDIVNDRLESVREQQPLGVLYEAGAEELDGWSKDLPILGIPWQQDWHEPGSLTRIFEPWRSSSNDLSRSLVVTHASIYPPDKIGSLVFEALHPESIAAAMDNKGYLHHGHIHDDHGLYEVDGVTFSNPGAISRGSLTEENQQRKIKGSLWTPEKGFLELELPHLPAEEIYFLAEAAELKESKVANEKFLEEVGSTRLEISSVAGVIEHIRNIEEAGVTPAIKKAAIELLEEQDV